MLAAPALALLLVVQPEPTCAEEPGRPAAVYVCRADQHLARFDPGERGAPENERVLRAAADALMHAATLARDTEDFAPVTLKLVRLFAPDRLNDSEKAVPLLQHLIENDADNLPARFTLAAVLESRGDGDEAKQLLEQTRMAFPEEPAAAAQLASFHHREASRTWEVLSRGSEPDTATRQALLEAGLVSESRSLELEPQRVDAVVMKERYVRALADVEPGASRRATLLTEADELRVRAARLQQGRGLAAVARPSAGNDAAEVGSEWLRAPSRTFRAYGGAPAPAAPPALATAVSPPPGEELPSPTLIKQVPPVYPQEAIDAGVEGSVTIEALIDEQGKVTDAKVITSVPLLDAAAVAAVRQWEYAPTLRNGQPVPVVARVTIGFSLRR